MYKLAHDLHFALCPTRTIFLDVGRARYFCLAVDPDQAFRRWANGDRGDGLYGQLDSLVAKGYLTAASEGSTPERRFPILNTAAEDIKIERIDAPWRIIVPVLIAFVRAQWIIRHGGFKAAIDCVSTPGSGKIGPRSETARRDVVRAYLIGRRRIPFAPACLRDSLAMLIFLRRQGLSADFIVGVSDTPFTAHCWLQDRQVVLNDTVENVADFVPILVIRP